jgi:hypothetical protein
MPPRTIVEELSPLSPLALAMGEGVPTQADDAHCRRR